MKITRWYQNWITLFSVELWGNIKNTKSATMIDNNFFPASRIHFILQPSISVVCLSFLLFVQHRVSDAVNFVSWSSSFIGYCRGSCTHTLRLMCAQNRFHIERAKLIRQFAGKKITNNRFPCYFLPPCKCAGGLTIILYVFRVYNPFTSLKRNCKELCCCESFAQKAFTFHRFYMHR